MGLFYRALKVLVMVLKDLETGLAAKEKFDNTIVFLEPFLESAPQLVVKVSS